jgi:hypothetical protein
MIGHIPKSYFPTTFKDFATATPVPERVTGEYKYFEYLTSQIYLLLIKLFTVKQLI